MASCFCCVSQHPAPNTQLQTPGAQHPAPGIQHPLPNAPHPPPSMRRTLQSTSGPNAQQLAPSVQHPTPSAPHPAKTSEIRFHLVLMNFPNGETVLFLLNFTRPDAKLFPATLQRCVENEKNGLEPISEDTRWIRDSLKPIADDVQPMRGLLKQPRLLLGALNFIRIELRPLFRFS